MQLQAVLRSFIPEFEITLGGQSVDHPIDGTSESINVNTSKSHCLQESHIDLRVRGSGFDDVSAQVPVSFVNHDGERACFRSYAAHISSNVDNRNVNRYVVCATLYVIILLSIY